MSNRRGGAMVASAARSAFPSHSFPCGEGGSTVRDVTEIIVIDGDDEEVSLTPQQTPSAAPSPVSSPSKSPHLRRRALKRRQTSRSPAKTAAAAAVAAAAAAAAAVQRESPPLPSAASAPLALESLGFSDTPRLREILMTQLDIIQKQTEDILSRDRKLKDLQKENEKLRQKLKQLEFVDPKRNEAKSRKVSRADKAVGPDTGGGVGVDPSMPVLEPQVEKQQQQPRSASASKRGGSAGRGRKRSCSRTPGASTPRALSAEKEQQRKKLFKPVETATSDPYFLLRGEDHIAEERREMRQILRQAETPQWRVVKIPAAAGSASPPPLRDPKAPTAAERTDDEPYLRRHAKMEVIERRRKRWDIQRIREQRNVERLKASYKQRCMGWTALGLNGGKRVAAEAPSTLLPGLEALEALEVDRRVPVTAFGTRVPALKGREAKRGRFRLDW